MNLDYRHNLEIGSFVASPFASPPWPQKLVDKQLQLHRCATYTAPIQEITKRAWLGLAPFSARLSRPMKYQGPHLDAFAWWHVSRRSRIREGAMRGEARPPIRCGIEAFE
jgi:hypothetical protein